MGKLKDQLTQAVASYYDDGEAEFTDDEFDALQEHARRRGVEISTMSPPPVGSPWAVVEHAFPMPGIDLVLRTPIELKEAFEAGSIGRNGWTSHKLDGLSLELVYTGGELRQAILRGDGMRGEDVVVNALHLQGVPRLITRTLPTSIRCEVVISTNNLEILNDRREADGKKRYSSKRSAVAMIRARSANQHDLKLLAAVVVNIPWLANDRAKYGSELSTLAGNGVKKFLHVTHVPCNPAQAWKYRNHAQESRGQLPYQLDGVVYVDDELRMAKLKFDPTAAVTKVIEIVEQLGRTGVVSPVCRFEPVELIGASVQRASAHNAELIERELHGLGVGATILVSRRGDVIPHVERVVEPADVPWVPSGKCPSCGSDVITDGSTARCSADPGECPGTVVGLMRKFCVEIGTKGLNAGVLTAMVVAGIDTPAQLYSLDAARLSQVMMAGGQRIGEARASAIVAEMASKTEMTLGLLLGAISIPGCAKSVMEAVAEKFPDVEQLETIDQEELVAVPGVGPTRAAAIAAYLDTRYADIIEPLLQVVTVVNPSGPLSGSSVCITLGLNSGSRPQVEARIRAAGGKVKSSVGKGLTYLVCNYPDENTAKLKAAKAHGIKIISEQELLEIIGKHINEKEPKSDDQF